MILHLAMVRSDATGVGSLVVMVWFYLRGRACE